MADFNETINNLNDTADTTDEFSPEDIEKNKVMAILAYFSWLVLIPLFGAKDSKFARFHCNQGIVLAIAEFIALFICGLLAKIPAIGWIFSIVEGVIGLVCLIFAILGIVNAANGRAKDLPVIGNIRILK